MSKWRKRATVEDLKTGPKEPRSTVLTEAEEAMIVAVRRHTLHVRGIDEHDRGHREDLSRRP